MLFSHSKNAPLTSVPRSSQLPSAAPANDSESHAPGTQGSSHALSTGLNHLQNPARPSSQIEELPEFLKALRLGPTPSRKRGRELSEHMPYPFSENPLSGKPGKKPAASPAAGMPNDHFDVKDELNHWSKSAPTEMEKRGRIRSGEKILNAYAHSSTELDLSDQHLAAMPDCLGKLTSLRYLNLSGNPLTEFPASQLIRLKDLQTIQLSMNASEGKPIRRSHEALQDSGYKIIPFLQGNSRAKVLHAFPEKATALYTTDLAPCLAVMLIQGNKSLCAHVDSYSGAGIGGLSTYELLSRHIKPNDADTKIFLVGANDQGSAANLRGVLSSLQILGLAGNVKMAGLGEGYTSAALDLKNKTAYVGKG